jgi:glycosyltransferase involved in cell wall biosynthesis
MFMSSSSPVVGIVSPDAPPHLGGMGRHVGILIDGLKKEGMTVHVFDRSRRPIFWCFGRNIGFSVLLRGRLQAWIRQNRINVLQIHAGPGGVLSRLPRTVPTIVVANHTYASQSRLPGQRWKTVFLPIERRMYRDADRVIAISSDTAESLVADYGIDTSRITVIPCGIDLHPWIAADTEERTASCVFIGRPGARKGFDLLEAAWSIARKSIPHAELSVIGWNDASRRGIRFLGRVSDGELHRLVGRASLTVCPSRLEGFGLAAAESIAAGTPVIATNVAGLRQVIRHGETGLLVDLSADDLSRAILSVLSNDVLRQALHDGCRRDRKRFAAASGVAAHAAVIRALYS